MDSFLKHAKLRDGVTLVAGNESADLDSIVSAIVFAYLATKENTYPGHVFVPLVQIPRDELTLRPDIQHVLRDLTKYLLFLDDIPLHPRISVNLLLVDHNKPLESFTKQFESIHLVGIVDHHPDEHTPISDPIVHKISSVGSCTTLVISLFKDTKDVEVSKLALAPILVDTYGLKTFAEGGRATDLDIKIAQQLLESVNIDTTLYLDSISSARMEGILIMSDRDLLRRDYKEVTASSIRLGTSAMASSKTSYRWWKDRSRSDIQKAIPLWADEKSLDVVSVMFGYEDDEHTQQEKRKSQGYNRDLAIYCPAKKIDSSVLFDAVKNADNATLDLEEIERKDDFVAWRQYNIKASRKQVLPIMRTILERLHARGNL